MKFVPLNKQSKKRQKEYHQKNRSDWKEVDPVTKVIPDKRKKMQDKWKTFAQE